MMLIVSIWVMRILRIGTKSGLSGEGHPVVMALVVLLLRRGMMGVCISVVVACWQLGNGTQPRCLVIGAIGRVGVVGPVVVVVGVDVVGVVEVVGGDRLRLEVGGGGFGFESEDFAEFEGAAHCGCLGGGVVRIVGLVGGKKAIVVMGCCVFLISRMEKC